MPVEKDQLAAARQHYANQVRNLPGKPEPWLQLGSVNVRMGLYQEALDCFHRVIELDRRSVAGHMCFAQTLLILNRYEDAESSLSTVLSIDPGNAQAAFNLAKIMELRGSLEDAARLYNVTLCSDPANIDALLGLGRVTEASGLHADAEAIYKRALEVQPGNASAFMLLGSLSLKTGALYRAEEYFRHAIDSEPGQAVFYYHLGRTQGLLGRVDAAMDNYRRAAKISPEFADATGGIAEIHTLKGEYEKAYECIQSIIVKGIPSVQVAVVLADICRALDICDKAVDYVRLVIANQHITHDSRIALQHVLGKLYDARGEYDKAFNEYREANRMQPAGPAPEIQDQYIDRVIRIWNRQYLSIAPKASNAAGMPVFIVGMPRSGSTLVEQILSAHPDVNAGGELPYMQELIWKLTQRLGAGEPYPDCLGTPPDRELIDELANEYLEKLRVLSDGRKLVTDKMWINYEHLGLISLFFPSAKIIHIVRNPLDTCLSMYFQYFANRLPFSNDLGKLGRYYRSYTRLMRHWKSVLDIRVLEVDYEELVGQQEPVTRSILEFCGLQWDESCLDFHKSRRHTRTVSQEQVHSKMYRTSVNRWRNYEKYIDRLRTELGDIDM